jgi:CO/xanthine dehydrogenase FAD-binding subunit
MQNVGYFAPTEVSQAVKLLAEHGKKATVLAGGTDLVPQINYYELKPEILVYIGGLKLDYIKAEGGQLVIGAGTPIAKLLESDLVAKQAKVLADAARQHSSVAIRSVGTIGGNIANGSPAADLVCPLMVMDAKLKLVSATGERMVAIEDFFVGPGVTVLKPEELLTEIQIPAVKGKAVYAKLGKRKAQACSIVITGVRLELDGKVCKAARVALGSMAPKPLRCKKAEALLVGKTVNAALVAQVAAAAVGESSPIDDVRATAWYRQKAGTALVAGALAQAAGLES